MISTFKKNQKSPNLLMFVSPRGHPGVILGHPGVILGHTGGILGHPGSLWGHHRSHRGHLGSPWGRDGHEIYFKVKAIVNSIIFPKNLARQLSSQLQDKYFSSRQLSSQLRDQKCCSRQLSILV